MDYKKKYYNLVNEFEKFKIENTMTKDDKIEAIKLLLKMTDKEKPSDFLYKLSHYDLDILIIKLKKWRKI